MATDKTTGVSAVAAAMEVDGGNAAPPAFKIPVDSEGKATSFRLFSLEKPHMLCFHLSFVSFFCCFCSSFAAPPLLPLIRDTLGLTAVDIGNAGIASVSGAVFARVMMGSACDLVGPRLASSSLILITAPAVFCSAVIDSAAGYLLVRFFTGFSLASFVSTQYWMSSMFSPSIVGLANGIAAGWGNLGGGAVQLLMPLVYEAIVSCGATNFSAWRIAFFIPGLMQTFSAIAVMAFGQDLPHGSFKKLHKSGEKHKDTFGAVVRHGVGNYRAWLLALIYGYCFGVELTVDNIIAQYLYDQFGIGLSTAGLVAASFGMANLFSRPGGGLFSDVLSRQFGMRGRLWGLYIVQTLGGVLAIILGIVNYSFGATVTVMVFFSIAVECACGLTFGVVPFVSRRSLGVVSGMTGGGGNVGAVITQLIFFNGSQFSTQDGITYMGMMMIGVSLASLLIYFPQWGGALVGPRAGVTAEDYYMREWTEQEKEKGIHASSMKFAENSIREGGRRREEGSGSGAAPAEA